MNKKQTALYETYRRALHTDNYDLSDVYSRPSPAKRRAYKNIAETARRLDGYGMRVFSATSFFYSQAFLYDTVDPATGEVLDTRLRYYTGRNVYDFSIR